MSKPKNMTPEQEAAHRKHRSNLQKKYWLRKPETERKEILKRKAKSQYENIKNSEHLVKKNREKSKKAMQKQRLLNPDKIKKHKKVAYEKFKNNPERYQEYKEKNRIAAKLRRAQKRAEKGEEYEWFMANLMVEAEEWNGEPLPHIDIRQQIDATP